MGTTPLTCHPHLQLADGSSIYGNYPNILSKKECVMVKIIIKNMAHDERVIQCQCDKCKSLLEYQVKEGIAGADKDGSYRVFTCPVCQRDIFIADHVIEEKAKERPTDPRPYLIDSDGVPPKPG